MHSQRIFLFFVLFLLLSVSFAGEPPSQVIQETTERVLKAFEEDDDLRNHPEKVQALMAKVVIPAFDFERLSQLVLGKHWRSATPDQRERFMWEFQRLILRTYAAPLAHNPVQKVEFLPMTQDSPSTATVRTRVRLLNAPTMLVDYKMHRKDGQWKVYDVVVEGISLAVTYRSSFGQAVRRGGMDHLIVSLSRKLDESSAETETMAAKER